MLLDLYLAAERNTRPVSISSLCIASAVPATTALRWIKTFEDLQLISRRADPSDGRRIFIQLVSETKRHMAELIAAWMATESHRDDVIFPGRDNIGSVSCRNRGCQ